METVEKIDLVREIEYVLRCWKNAKITDREAIEQMFFLLMESGYDI